MRRNARLEARLDILCDTVERQSDMLGRLLGYLEEMMERDEDREPDVEDQEPGVNIGGEVNTSVGDEHNDEFEGIDFDRWDHDIEDFEYEGEV
jgi:hypothetical protein